MQMTKTIWNGSRKWGLLVILSVFVLSFSGCKNDKPFEEQGEVTFKWNDPAKSNTTLKQAFVIGTPVSVPKSPEAKGYQFAGWHTEANMNASAAATSYDFTEPERRKDLTLYAWWRVKGATAGPNVPGNDSAAAGNGEDSSAVEEEAPFLGTSIDGIYSVETWNAAVSQIKNGGNSQSYRMNIIGDFALPGLPSTDYTFGKNLTNIEVEIRGRGNNQISLENNGSLLRVYQGQRVALKGVTLRGGTNNTSLVVVDAGTFEMKGNAAVSGNSGSEAAVTLSSGTFTMRDYSTVSGNTNTEISTPQVSNGGGGVAVHGGTFTMLNYATVSDNVAMYCRGGGVYVKGAGTFVMQDYAKVSGNTAGDYGGGVYIDRNTTFTMQDSTIVSGNSTTAADGGGVHIEGGTFTMEDAAMISGNSAVDAGGGVAIGNNGNFRMKGTAMVISNTATIRGSGVDIWHGTLMLESGTIFGNDAGSNSNSGGMFGTLSKSTWGVNSAIAEYGVFNGDVWTPAGTLNSTDGTIRVSNGKRLP